MQEWAAEHGAKAGKAIYPKEVKAILGLVDAPSMPSDSRGTKRPRRKRKGNKPTRVRRLFRVLSDTESEEIIPRAGTWSLPVQLPRAAQQQEENTPALIGAAEQAASAQALGASAADSDSLMAQTPSRAARDPRLALHSAATPTGPARALMTAGAQGQALLGGAPQQADNPLMGGLAQEAEQGQGQMENLAAVELPQPQGANAQSPQRRLRSKAANCRVPRQLQFDMLPPQDRAGNRGTLHQPDFYLSLFGKPCLHKM